MNPNVEVMTWIPLPRYISSYRCFYWGTCGHEQIYVCEYLNNQFFFSWIVDDEDDDDVEMVKVIVNEKENQDEFVKDLVTDYYGDDYYYDDYQQI